MQLSRSEFGNDFHWGVSTAAYQIEGAYKEGGKGPSIWDVFSATKGKTPFSENGNIACDFYHRYYQDILLMRTMNIPNYRFSISWSRIFPAGTGKVNYDGVDFYDRVIDCCIELGIKPWITLYHWDLPWELEKRGGWTNRDIINWFSDYVSFCISRFGDRVKHWMVLNEPMAFTGAGYFLGLHAPGRKGLSSFFSAAHHAALCQADGGRIIRSSRGDCKVGTTFSYSHLEPESGKEEDLAATCKMDALLNRMFIEPLLGMSYPVKDLKALLGLEKYIKQEDESRLAFNMDFIGIQNYTREIIRHSYFVPFLNAQIVKADKRGVDKTLMNWEIYPRSIYHTLKKYADYAAIPELIITENGAAFQDMVINEKVCDEPRISYYKTHLAEVLKAKREGINVKGYFIWSFMDNFEWAEGYYPRFGLVYVNFKTQKRIVKSSGWWYSSFLSVR